MYGHGGTNIMNKAQRYQQSRIKKIKPIGRHRLDKYEKQIVKEGGVYVLRALGKELRNPSKINLLKDLATIQGMRLVDKKEVRKNGKSA